MLITKHMSGSIYSTKPIPAQKFNNMKELLEVPFVKRWTDHTLYNRENFYRFSLYRIGETNILIAEYDKGQIWWAVGYITGHGIGLLDLPEPSYIKVEEHESEY